MAATLQNWSDCLNFFFKIHFLKVCQLFLFSLCVIVPVELSGACNIHMKGAGAFQMITGPYVHAQAPFQKDISFPSLTDSLDETTIIFNLG